MLDNPAVNLALKGLFSHLVPEMVLAVAACVLFLGGTFKSDRRLWSGVALASLGLALLAHFFGPASHATTRETIFSLPVQFDNLAGLVRVLALVSGMLLVVLTHRDMPARQVADHHACLLVILAGVSLVGAANDLVTLFVALELISIPTYIMLYLPKHDDASQEASMKYFLLSVFSSAILLFGFSYLYGLAGTTNLAAILELLYRSSGDEAAGVAGMAQIALVMIVAGLGFRVTAVPFHFYAPDVYQGVSNGGAAFLSYIPKIAGFVALIRVLGFVMPPGVENTRELGLALTEQVPIVLWFIAAVTMFLGNLLALLQDNLKRMLAYSSIANAGYMLVALASAPFQGSDSTGGVVALLFYLVAYGTATIGVFSAIAYLSTDKRPVESLDDLAGLGRTQPGAALMLAVLMFSMIGIPLTAGFAGKFLIFFGALSAERMAWLYGLLALIGVLNAAIAGWYYLRVVTMMYLRSAIKPLEGKGNRNALASLAICVLLVLAMGVPPGSNLLLGAVRKAAGVAVAAPAPAALR